MKLESTRQSLHTAAKVLPAYPLCGKAYPQPEQNAQAFLDAIPKCPVEML